MNKPEIILAGGGIGGLNLALAAYENSRRPATAEVVRANRTRAHDRMLDLVHARVARGYADINDVIDRAELEQIVSG